MVESDDLLFAVVADDLEDVKRLLAAGANANGLDPLDYTPLMHASRYGNEAIVRLLLSAGAEVNATRRGGSWPLSDRWESALSLAARYGHLWVVHRLLSGGADVSLTNDGRTVLMDACEGGNVAVVEALLAAGADLNGPAYRPAEGALYVASEAGHLDVVLALLKAGAYPWRTRFGDGAIERAERNNHEEVLAALLEAERRLGPLAAAGEGPGHCGGFAPSGHGLPLEHWLDWLGLDPEATRRPCSAMGPSELAYTEATVSVLYPLSLDQGVTISSGPEDWTPVEIVRLGSCRFVVQVVLAGDRVTVTVEVFDREEPDARHLETLTRTYAFDQPMPVPSSIGEALARKHLKTRH